MGLFDMFKKPAKKKTSNSGSVARDLNHLTSDGELPYGWYYANREFAEQVREEYGYFMRIWHEAQNKDVLEQFAALKSFVLHIEDAQQLCARKGECFVKWLSDVVVDPGYYDECKARLEYMVEHKEELFQQEAMLKKLKKDLLAIIEAEPGVSQEKLYKRFEPDMKSQISNVLYGFAAQGVIRREKSGRSYALFMK